MVWGADWQHYSSTEEAFFYYDAESITHSSNDIVTVSEKRVYADDGINFMAVNLGGKYKDLHHGVCVYEVNCKDKTSRRVSLMHYTEDGTVIYSSDRQSEWRCISPRSLHVRLHEILCEQRLKEKVMEEEKLDPIETVPSKNF